MNSATKSARQRLMELGVPTPQSLAALWGYGDGEVDILLVHESAYPYMQRVLLAGGEEMLELDQADLVQLFQAAGGGCVKSARLPDDGQNPGRRTLVYADLSRPTITPAP